MAEMEVTLIDSMGSDLSVVDAARVSFAKESEWETPTGGIKSLGFERDVRLSVKDRNLIHYLAEHNHWSPFSHCYLKFRIKAPIFVARQLQKHVVGLAWNEVSRRYVDSDPEFYEPTGWRKRAENVKQGSGDKNVALTPFASFWTKDYAYDAEQLYLLLLEEGVCPEQARMVLPQSMMTEWIWSGSLYAFARVCKQRLDSHAQAETRLIAAHIYDHLSREFPVSTEALLG